MKDMKKFLKTSVYNVFRWLFKSKVEAAIFLAVFLIEMTFGFYLVYLWGSTHVLGGVFGGDLIAQLHISRAVVDNGYYSGIQNLGTVWLPVPNLLRVPFIVFDVLYTTGLAATIVNALLTAGTCVLLYRFVGERVLGVLAVTLFMMNVYTLAMGASAFQMPPAIFFMMLSVCYFKYYWEKDSLPDFVKCSIAVILATLSRYECWSVMVSIVFLFVVREIKNKRMYRLAYAHFPFWGVFVWLFWNLAIFRDPFRWLLGGGRGYINIASRAVAPQIQRVLTYSIPGMFTLSGFLMAFLPISLMLMLKRRDYGKLGVILVLLAPLVLVNMASWPGNERVLYAALPGAILIPLYIVRNEGKRFKIFFILLLFLTFSFALPAQYNIFVEAVYMKPSVESLYSKDMDVLKNAIGHGSTILTSSAGARDPGRWLSVVYGISPSKIIDEYDYKLFTKVSNEPWLYADWVIVTKFKNTDDPDVKAGLEERQRYYGAHFFYLYYYNSTWHDEFVSYYNLVLETSSLLLFQRAG